MLEIHSYLPDSSVEGPERRFVIWVQGCSIRCEGCSNKQMWDMGKGRRIPVEELFTSIRAQKDIDGVTFLGGEPFDQAKPLAKLAEKVRQIGLGVVAFTGYLYEELKINGSVDQHALLNSTDLLIDGPFLKEKQTLVLPWAGSSNQHYIHITNRYVDYGFSDVENRIEVRYDGKQKRVIINGLEDTDVIDRLVEKLKKRGIIG